MSGRKRFGGQPKDPVFTAFPSYIRSRRIDSPIICPKGHPLLVDVPEDEICIGPGNERTVPASVTGVWKAWCDVCREGSWYAKRAGELLVIKGERRDIPTPPPPLDDIPSSSETA